MPEDPSLQFDNPMNVGDTDEEVSEEAVEPGSARAGDEEEINATEKSDEYKSLSLVGEFARGEFDELIDNWCKRASVSTWLDVTIISAIMINTFLLAWVNPANLLSDDTLFVCMIIDMVLTVLFTWEMFVRIIAMGFYNPKYKHNPLPEGVSWPEIREGREEQQYLNDAWNKLDFVVVISSWVNVIVEATGIQLGIEVSTLRALRVLRVLRSLKFFSGIKTILNVIAQAMPYSLNVVAFMAFLYIVCGIIGLQMFRGHTLSRCEYGSFDLQVELQHDKFPLVYPNGSDSHTIIDNDHPSPKPITVGEFTPTDGCEVDGDLTECKYIVRKRETALGPGTEYPLGIGMWFTYCTQDSDCPLYNKHDEYNRTQVCVPSSNPGKMQHNFDKIMMGWVALFINMANLYWWETSYRISEANDGLGSVIAWGYGIFNVMFLTYVSVNMFVAVITTVFADVRGAEAKTNAALEAKQAAKEEKARAAAASGEASPEGDDEDEDADTLRPAEMTSEDKELGGNYLIAKWEKVKKGTAIGEFVYDMKGVNEKGKEKTASYGPKKRWNQPFYYVDGLGGAGGPYVQKVLRQVAKFKNEQLRIIEENTAKKEKRGPDYTQCPEELPAGFINKKPFDNFIMAWILINTVILYIDYHSIDACCSNSAGEQCTINGMVKDATDTTCSCSFNPDNMCQSENHVTFVKYLNYLFNFIFTIELILKVWEWASSPTFACRSTTLICSSSPPQHWT